MLQAQSCAAVFQVIIKNHWISWKNGAFHCRKFGLYKQLHHCAKAADAVSVWRNGSWPSDAFQEMQPGNKDAGGSLCGSNTGGTGKGSRGIRQWERVNRKVQCKQKTSLPCFTLTLAFKAGGQKAIAAEKAAEDQQRMPGGCCSHCLFSQREEQSHNLMGLGCRGQIQDLHHPESWVQWISISREDPQALSPHGESVPAGIGYCCRLGRTLTTQEPHQSWSLSRQMWMGCY